ncbi:MAG TPA: hypothetical protein VGN17_19610 [Bryobacteraceae bacterium]|jgi:hypothetical protein
MNTREQLNHYLHVLETRLRWMAISRGVAIAAGVALGATLALVLITNALAFSETSMVVARVVLFLSLAGALGYALVLPLTKLNQRRAAGKAEVVFPQFDTRLVTYVEKSTASDPMLELLADDTNRVASQTIPTHVAPPKSIFAFATGAGAAGAVLLWMILEGASIGFIGFGANLLWAGAPKGLSGSAGGYYDIQVDPGSKLVRRKSDVPITAKMIGFSAQQVHLMLKYQSSSKWEDVAMLTRANGSDYEFLFTALPEPVDYYVQAGSVKSKSYRLDVVDLPNITHIKTTYHLPSWLGSASVTEDPSGDLRQVAGTVAEVEITTDKPLKNGAIEMEDGSRINLEAGANNTLIAKVPLQKDGLYHFAALEQGQGVRLTQDYFIEAQEDQAPSVRITHPGADAKVLPIEEVAITVEAQDDFGLQGVDLHYRLNGGAEKTLSLLANKGVKTADGKTVIALEDLNMKPGDQVSLYATAKDARNTTQTDLFFIEAQPYERNYSQSQQGGGGGGGGGGGQQGQDLQQVIQRQKQIIVATHNALRPNDRTRTPETAGYLSDTEKTLKAQAESLAQRATSRELTQTNNEFQSLVKDMTEAANQMGAASDKLKAQKWPDSEAPEQLALTALLRADATFRDIQVAFGNRGGGGGGGGGGNAGRDLANLFDLELDTEKNQYEQQSAGGGNSAEQQQKEVDDAMAKLEQLAKRQQELANQNKNNKQQSLDQRYQQEQLRREAEELQKKLEQLQQTQQGMNRNGSQQAQQSGQQQGGQQGGQQQGGKQSNSQQGGGQQQASQQSGSQQNNQGQQSQQGNRGGQQTASSQQLERAINSVKQAAQDMRNAQNAAQQGKQGDAQAQAEQRRAADRLQEAADAAANNRRQDAAARLGNLENRAADLAQQQHGIENRMKEAYGDQTSQDARLRAKATAPDRSRQTAESIADEKKKLGEDVDKTVKDIQQAARDLQSTQPNASSRLRDGASEVEQYDVKQRITQSERYTRAGQGSQIVQWDSPVTQALDKMRQDVQAAQQALQQGNQQAAGRNNQERQLATVEQTRQQLEQLAQRGQQAGGQQQGNQQGGQQQASQQQGGQKGGGQKGGGQQGGGQQPGGQQPGGQQPGGQQPGGQQGGGQQGGGQQNGNGGGRNGGQVSPNGGGFNGGYNAGNPNGFAGPYDPQLGPNRFNAPGVYDAPEIGNVSPSQVIRGVQQQIDQLRQQVKDDPNAARLLQELEASLNNMQVGQTASPELAERISRTVLPKLDEFEVLLRRNIEEKGGGNARAGAPDRVPDGFQAPVEEYSRKLSKGK